MDIVSIVQHFGDARKNSNGWQVRCPCHEDAVASLSVHQEDDGRVFVHCHAGCSTEAVLSAVGLKLADLYPEGRTKFKNGSRAGSIIATYDYVDAGGKLLFQSVRLEPKSFRLRRRDVSGSSASWVWNMEGITKTIYRLPHVNAAIASGQPILIVEGEKDVHSLERLGFTATCNPGGAGKWLLSFSPLLAGADVVILPDNDSPGRDHAEKVAVSLTKHAASVKVIALPGLPPKGDVTDWVEQGGTEQALRSLIDTAEPWQPSAGPAPTAGKVGLDGYLLNDLGNARRLVARYGPEIRYCCDAGRWYAWDGTRWAWDETGEVCRRAKAVVDAMHALALETQATAQAAADDRLLAEARAFERHAIVSGNHSKLLAMISQAESEPGISVLASQLDADPWLFNTINGTIDLRTGTLHPHDREQLISKRSPVTFDPHAACPTWDSFISSVFADSSELQQFIQAAAGYTLTGDTREQVFFILNGGGSNGKSTFITALREIFGDYETKTATETLVEKQSSNTNDIAALRGARFVNAIETSAGKKLAEALVKELTGQDAISARFLYHEFFSFTPVFKLWLACNHVPIIEGQEDGIWRRVRMVPFSVKFHDPDEAEGPYKDKDLPDKLRAEYPGILAWLVRGCLDWQRGGLPVAAAVKAATGKYQRDMDLLGGFLSERCEFGRHLNESAKNLYAAYCEWAVNNGEKPLSQRWFGLRLGEREGLENAHTRVGKVWWGISLVEDQVSQLELSDSRNSDGMTHVKHTHESSLAREDVHESVQTHDSIGTFIEPESHPSHPSHAPWAGGVAL